MNIAYIYGDNTHEWNSSEWRCAAPARAINSLGVHSATLVSKRLFARRDPIAVAACDAADIIVVERYLFRPVTDCIVSWLARGKTVVADFDDAYHLIDQGNAAYDYWGRSLIKQVAPNGQVIHKVVKPDTLTQFRLGLRMCNAITTPSKVLCADYGDVAPAYHIPNWLDMRYYNRSNTPTKGRIVIGWGGSISHQKSWADSEVIPALQRVLQARADVDILVAGDDARIAAMLGCDPERVKTVSWTPYDRWHEILGRYNIGLAPLAGEYDARRSWIKVAEYEVMGIPYVASQQPPYDDTLQLGVLVPNTAEAWEYAIMNLVNDYKAHRQRAMGQRKRARAYYDINRNISKTIETYNRILRGEAVP